MRISVRGNVSRLRHPIEPWRAFAARIKPGASVAATPSSMPRAQDFLTTLGRNPRNKVRPLLSSPFLHSHTQHSSQLKIFVIPELDTCFGESASRALAVPLLTSLRHGAAHHLARGPPAGLADPDYPALMVARAVLNGISCLLWDAIRGPGLAYGAWQIWQDHSELCIC